MYIQGFTRAFYLLTMKENREKRSFIEADIYIFDMDGTLYSNEDGSTSIKESRLLPEVKKHSLNYIQEMENCNLFEAQKTLDLGFADEVGISRFLARKYQITRKEYFDEVWGRISPEGIIFHYELAQNVIKRLKKYNKNIFLLTAAPLIWAKKVLTYLDLMEDFEEIYSGEMFEQKDEMFTKIRKRFPNERILSIGDQLETDIYPAQSRRMMTFYVKKTSDLTRLLNGEYL